MHQDTRSSADREASAFLRSVLLAAALLAALRTPRTLFGLRAFLPGELAGPGDILAACLAGTSAGVLACDSRGRFMLATSTTSGPSTSRPRASAPWSRWYLRASVSLRASRRPTSTSSACARAEGRAAS